MWDASSDPLGIGLQSRAAQSRFNYGVQNPGTSFGPGHSAAWDGFFQALNEAGVSHLGDSSTRMGFGPQFGSLPSTYNPSFQTSAVRASGPSNQIGTPGIPQSMSSLQQSVGRTAKKPAPVKR